MKIGYVYIIKSNGLYKIGRAWNLVRRLDQLRTAAPFLKEIHSIRSRESHDLERWLHAHFSHKRIVGEWFALDEDDLDFITTVDGHGSQLTHTKLLMFCEKVKKIKATRSNAESVRAQP